MAYRFLILGEPLLEGPGGRLNIRSGKGLALLCYCAAQREREFSRSALAELLWEDPRAGLDSLGMTLMRLRREMPVWPLRVTRRTVGWDPRSDVFLDVRRFKELLTGSAPQPPSDEALEEASRLWRGPFLEGLNPAENEDLESWLVEQRTYWEQRILRVLSDLIARREARSDWRGLIGIAQRAIALDPLREDFHRALIQAHYRMGDRASALSRFHACRAILRAELGIEPDPSTLRLEGLITGEEPKVRSDPEERRSPSRIARPTFDPARAPALPLIDREGELGSLRDALALAAAGTAGSRLVLLQGEAGIGKTRLVDELIAEAHQARGVPWGTLLLANCLEEFQSIPYRPLAEAMSNLLPGLDPHRLNIDDVWLDEAARLLPDLKALRPTRRRSPRSDPETGRQLLLEGVSRFLAALPPPVLLILEDAHWADEGTLAVLARLARLSSDRRPAVLLTARPAEISEKTARLLAKLREEGHLSSLDLPPLSEPSIQALATAMLGHPDPTLGDRLYRQSDGVPLFAVELLRFWLEEAGDAPDESPLPESLRSIIAQRLGHLQNSARRVFECLSLFPGGTSLGLLQRTIGLPRATLFADLERLLMDGLIQAIPAGAEASVLPEDDPRYALTHELVRRVVHQDMLPPKKAWLHRRVLSALGEEPLTATLNPSPEEMAFHATSGGLWEEGLIWNLRAADQGLTHAGVAHFLRQALHCLERLPGSSPLRSEEMAIRSRLAEVESMGLEQEDAPETAMDLPELHDATQAEAWLPRLATMLIQGRLGMIQTILDRLLPLIRASGRSDLLASALRYSGQVKAVRGDFDQAARELTEALRLYETFPGSLSPVDAVLSLAGVEAVRGNFAAARSLLAQTAGQANPTPHPMADAYRLIVEAAVAQGQGDRSDSAAILRKELVRTRTGRFPLLETLAALYVGSAQALTGDLQQGIRTQREAIAAAQRRKVRVLLDQAYARLGEMYLAAGNPRRARGAAEKGLAIARRDGYRYGVALNGQVLGEAAAALGQPAEAVDRITRAMVRFSELGARPQVARCNALLAELAASEEERAACRRRAVKMFAAMGMQPDLERPSLWPSPERPG